MNNVKKIQYLRELKRQKENIERKLASVNRSIEEQKASCLHIGVDLGYYGLYPSTGDKYRCLICGKGENEEYFYEPKYIVQADEYLPQYDITDEEQCDKKFDNIQTLTLDLLKEKPNMSREELAIKLNKLIQESISFSENQSKQKMVKTINPKK